MERYENRPFAIVGVNCYDSEEDYRKGVEEHGVTWTNAFQGEEAPIAELWGVRGFPTMHVIGPDGRIAALDVRGERQISAVVDRLLAELDGDGEGAAR